MLAMELRQLSVLLWMTLAEVAAYVQNDPVENQIVSFKEKTSVRSQNSGKGA